ncbi:ribonuclease HII [uncultured Maribacter sp.]|uniref:ribonuclease HII n=1 Tax=uncultured Maribacter sp. TaxID=431308 RepID=UPI0026258D19|nr:ribonuclease HII [uncultured Maribacter sp.]
MRFTYLSVIILLLSISCTSKKESKNSILDLIPGNAALILRINDFETLNSELSTNEIYSSIKLEKPFVDIKKILSPLHYFSNKTNGLITLSADSTKIDFTYITTDSLNHINFDSITNKSIETQSFKDYNITKYIIEKDTFYSTLVEEHAVLYSSKLLLENLLNSIDSSIKNESLDKFYNISDNEKVANIWINLEKGELLFKKLLFDNQNITNFTSWISLDLTLNDSELLLNGIAASDTDSTQFLNLFNGTKPIENDTWNIVPRNINQVTSYGLDDFKKYSHNKQLHDESKSDLDSLLNTVEEIVITEYEDESVLFLKTYGTATLLDYINEEKIAAEEFSSNEIWELKPNIKIFEPLSPLIGEQSFKYSSIIENTFVFSQTQGTLETVITKIKTGDTFNKTTLYKNAENKLTSSSSILSISNYEGFVGYLNKSVSSALANSFKKSKLNDYLFGQQIIADANFFHINFLINKVTKVEEQNSVTSAFEVQFDTDLSSLPQFVTNHGSGKKEIIVQDQENNLYLISSSGKILWKKQLNGSVQGKIEQIDLFKNGKLQFAFTTNNEFLILDRNGNEVAPFTKNYSGGNLNPLAVFDYDGRKNYRFVVTQGKKVFMYNSKGEIVKGFTYDTAEATILDAPQHFRIGKKDYLVFKLDNGKLKIINRVGKTRVNVKGNYSFSDNKIRLYQNKFTFTTLDGILYQIDSQGKISSSNLNLSKDHGMDATSRTLAIMNDNILQIRNKKIELELGVYSKPSIFYLNDKIYVSVTDIQNQKIYLFDSQAKPIPNFPVFGNSVIDMADINLNQKVEFVYQNQNNSIEVLKIQ